MWTLRTYGDGTCVPAASVEAPCVDQPQEAARIFLVPFEHVLEAEPFVEPVHSERARKSGALLSLRSDVPPGLYPVSLTQGTQRVATKVVVEQERTCGGKRCRAPYLQPAMPEPATPSHPKVTQPAYQKLSLIMLGLVALFYALGQAQPIVVPLLFALLLALLLNPLVNRFSRMHIPRVLGIALAVLLAMVCAAGVSYFILTQAVHFSDTLPDLQAKLAALGDRMKHWVETRTSMEPKAVDEAVAKARAEGLTTGGKLVGGALLTMGTVFAFAFLLPVFTFLFLLYKKLLLTFIARLFPETYQAVVQEVLQGSKGVAQHYLTGLILEAGIVTVLNFVGLLFLGMPYALLLSVLAAVLNLIPYVGMLVATLLAVVIALATRDTGTAVWVLALYSGVQFIDNNFIVPRVVASRVEINALFSIVVVMVGGALWGIPGMFLAIPLTAICKVVFDRVPGMEPFGFVLGSDDGSPKKPSLKDRLFAKRK